jgi:hypothetical protein
MGQYDTIYSSPTSWSSLGAALFTATLRLGDNGSGTGGVTEAILNGASQQLEWGHDGSNHVNSDVNYPIPPAGIYCPVDLLIPASTSPQTPAELTVGNASSIQYTGGSYSAITNVLVEAIVTGSFTGITGYVVVRWRNLSVVFTDSLGNQTTNPAYTPNLYAYAGNYATTGMKPVEKNKSAMLLPPGKHSPLNLALSVALATPSSNFANNAPVSVEIQGGIQIISTDDTYANYLNGLSSTALQAKILVWGS